MRPRPIPRRSLAAGVARRVRARLVPVVAAVALLAVVGGSLYQTGDGDAGTEAGGVAVADESVDASGGGNGSGVDASTPTGQLAFDSTDNTDVADGADVADVADVAGSGSGGQAVAGAGSGSVAASGTGLSSSATGAGEIIITVRVPDNPEGGGRTTKLSAEAAIACSAIERAVEANRTGDVAAVEAAVYEAFPYATSASEEAIVDAGTELLDALLEPTLRPTLNIFLNACVAAGYGV